MRPFLPSLLVLSVVAAVPALAGPAVAASRQAHPAKSGVIVSPRPGAVVHAERVRVRVRGSALPGAVQARLNGVDTGDQLTPAGHGILSFSASASDGLRHGTNVLRVTTRAPGGTIRTATVRFAVRTPKPLVGAGRNQRIAVGDAVELTGVVRGGGSAKAARARTRWNVVAAPRGAARLASPAGPTATFTATKPGRYTVRYMNGSGPDAVTDTADLSATPGALVPFETQLSGSAPGVKIGEAFYPQPVLHGYSGMVVQVVVLDRATLAYNAARSHTYTTDIGQLPGDLGKLDNTDLVVIAQEPARGSTPKAIAPTAYASIGVKQTGSFLDFSAIGVPDMQPGQANQNGDGSAAGALKGALTYDENQKYAFVPSARFPFRFGSQPQTPCEPCSSGNGFVVTVYDPVTFTQIPGPLGRQFWDTDDRDGNVGDMTEQAREMAIMLEQAPAGDIVTIESTTNQRVGEPTSRAPVGPIALAPMTRLAAAVASVGGTLDVFNQAAVAHGTAAVGQRNYTLVGWAGAGPGNGAEVGAGINGAPAAPTLQGVLRPNRQSQLRPAVVTDNGGDADSITARVMQPTRDDWPCWQDAAKRPVPCSEVPRVEAAISYIGLNAPPHRLTSNPRLAYSQQRWDGNEVTAIQDGVKNLSYPGTSQKCDLSDEAGGAVLYPINPPVAPVIPPTQPVTPPEAPVTPPLAPVTPPAEPVTPPLAPVTPPAEPVTPPLAPVTPPAQPVTPPLAPVNPPLDPVTPGSKFDSDEFCAAKQELLQEISYVANVRGYMTDLASPFQASSGDEYVDVKNIADQVYTASRQPTDNTLFQWLDFTKIFLRAASPFTMGATGVIGGVLDLGQWVAGVTATGTPTYDTVSIKADQVAAALQAHADSAQNQMASLADIIVSDPIKLGYFGRWGGCLAGSDNPDCPPELSWSTRQQAQEKATLTVAVKSFAYEQLVPIGFPIYTLTQQNSNSRFGHQGPWAVKPKAFDYICADARPWKYITPDSTTSVVSAVDPSQANSPAGMWYYQTYVMAADEGNGIHANPVDPTILKTLFNPVDKDGLGISPQQLLSSAPSRYWERNSTLEGQACEWGQ